MGQKGNNLFQAKEYENWIIFFLNYLNPYFSDNDFALFQKKWKSYWKLFQLWKSKKLENEAIKEIVKQLVSIKTSFSTLIKKYRPKEIIIDNSLLNNELERLWHTNDKNTDLEKKYLVNPQKIQNFLCGQIKKQFPKLDIRKISEIINEFAKTKIEK